ncbi:CCA tRNA nucleotidyltransferase [Pseudotabrizicola sp. L79]|uniref:CCA tRNA nucleotidyltransferase n=1 Tax=Pseudotabrizicola sp. L79 TaxID=3118402 RepID=UPI002F954CDE
MKITGDWLTHPGVVGLCTALEDAGHQALFVGGCVRNALMGRAVNDIDLSTDALPETVTNIAKNAGFKVVPTGIDHGTVTVIAQGLPIEVTTFRRDVETNGRHAVVAFSPKIEEDAARRDFTMNALYADVRGLVIDPLGGLPDLLAHRVRFVGDADARIREDYLRILRFFRFHAHYGDMAEGFDPEGLAACAAHSAGLETLSKERVGSEMRKLLAAPDPVPAVAAMAMAGVLAVVLPGADVRGLGPFVHLAALAGAAPDPIARLASLGGVNPAEALRLSRAEGRRLAALRAAIGSPMSAAELGYRLGATDGLNALVLRAALFEQPVSGQADVTRGAAAVFPVKAADLSALQGAELGRALRQIEARWIASDFRLPKAELLR